MVSKSNPALRLGLCALLAGVVMAGPAAATENGTSIYLEGSGGPGTAIMPPLQGIFLQNTFYNYSGSVGAERNFEIGGHIVAGVDGQVYANFPILAWVPTTDFLGGTVSLNSVVPFGGVNVNVGAELTGPNGGKIAVARNDSTFVVGDPLIMPTIGWKTGNLHLQIATFVNVPIGNYRDHALANIAFHRWAGDTSFAATWRDEKAGWDVSGKAGFTFNGTNEVTQYTTGTEFHLEGSVEKILWGKLEIGPQAFYFQQVTGDSGAGARLGPFKGRDVGVGGQAAYTFMVGKSPVTMRLHGFSEYDVQNRLAGRFFYLDLVMPLSVKLPKAPPQG
jgi:hypothetical protein